MDQFFETSKFNVKNSKKTLPEDFVRSKYSSKSSKSSSSSSNTSVKSNKSLSKTEKAKIFGDQTEKKAKRKLELIKRRQKLEEAETLNAVAEANERLKVAQMLEKSMEDIVSKHHLSVK